MTAEDCANQFYTDRVASMAKEMDGPGMTDDLAFEKYVSKCIVYWFLSRHERTDEGKIRDTVRKRLERDERFVRRNGRWGLVDGPVEASTARESILKAVASQYPIDMDADNGRRERRRAQNYGRTGQLENLLAGVLQAAEGTLELSTLTRAAAHRITAMRTVLAKNETDWSLDDEEHRTELENRGYDIVPMEDEAIARYDAQHVDISDVTGLLAAMKHNGREWTRIYIDKNPGVAQMLLDNMDNGPRNGEEL
ncbi:hypothetical protein [Bifidobacterium samirii]|nr:hypothetical protein [Bifidobacterium samirii]